jgi:hypothetical protein
MHRMKRAALIILGIVVVLMGASLLFSGDRTPARSLAQTTVGSVVLDSSAHVAALNAVEELRIDGTKEEFVPMYRVYVARDGTIIVPQLQDLRYVRYAPDGKKLGAFGAPGRGPCEFESQADHTAGWLGDTLWIHDPNARRVTYVSLAGECIDDEKVGFAFSAPRDLGRFPLFTRVYPWGMHGGHVIGIASSSQSILKPDAWTYERPLVSVGASGMIDRVLGDFPPFLPGDVARVGTETQGAMTTLPFRFYPILRLSSRSDRIGYVTVRADLAEGGHIRLVVLDPHGDTTVAREYAFAGTRVPERVIDSVIEVRASGARPAALGDAIRSETRQKMPPFYQPVRSLLFGEDSTIWLDLRGPETRGIWLMLDWHGNPEATITLPPNARLSVAQRNAIWTIELDKDDVPSVVRYRLEKAPSRH